LTRRKSIATVSLSGTLGEKLEAAAAAGFDGVEIFEADLLAFDGSPADVRDMCEGLGVTIDIYQPFRDFEAMPEPQRARNLDRAERKFDVMQALGTDLVLVCSNIQPACLDDHARAAADLREMAVRSRALVSADARFRLALNASDSRGTATGRMVSAQSGAGVHHVAFAVADIRQTAEALAALDAPVLPMPENYYDDLSARWGLDDAALAWLQQLNLLYDREADGEFWHLHTTAFHDRFFFEILQRRAYAGFGAANAGVRAAAHARQLPSEPAYA